MRLLPIAAIGLTAFALLQAGTPATTEATPPKPAPELVINMLDGSQKLLSSFRGKVIALECLFTTCPHCQHASQVFSQLYKEYGSRGFLPIGVAFNDDTFEGHPKEVVGNFVRSFNVTYPVGYTDRAKMLDFLGFSPYERFVVPQIVWIDRKGNIRSKTPPMGDDAMLKEPYWREMIEMLTKENPAATRHATAHHSAKK